MYTSRLFCLKKTRICIVTHSNHTIFRNFPAGNCPSAPRTSNACTSGYPQKMLVYNNKLVMNKVFDHFRKTLPWLFGLAVFLFFGLVYPHHLHYHEQFQLFLTTGDYFMDLAVKPGGIADYLGAFITQFFLFSWAGAAMLSVLLMLLQRLIFSVGNHVYPFRSWFALSFIPPIFYWILLCNENFMPAGIISV